MAKQRIPLVGGTLRRGLSNATNYAQDQSFYNCFYEISKNPGSGQAASYLNKRQGFSTFAIGPSGYVGGYAATSWLGAATNPGKVIFAFCKTATGDNAICDYAGTQVGIDIPGYIACMSLTETMISGVSNLIAIMLPSGATPVPEAWYFAEGGAWTKIASNFPSNLGTPIRVVGEPVHMDGYMFIMGHNGRIYNSDLNSVTTWSTTGYIEAQQSPDVGCGLVKYKNMIVALGPGSMEFFQNSGNATGSPLTRVQYISNIGCVPTYFVGIYQQYAPTVTVGDTFYWLGMDARSGGVKLYRMNGMQPEEVSTPSISRMFGASINFKLWGSLNLHGLTHVMFSSQSQDGSYPAYCHETGQWWFFKPGESDAITRFHASSYIGASYLTNASRNRYIATVYPGTPVYQDNSTNFTMTVQTQPLDHGTDNLKECTAFRLIADTQTTAGNVGVAYSDNDYSSFSTAKNIDMTLQQKKLDAGLGWFRRRSWKITETVNRPFRAQAFEVEFEVAEE